MRSASSRSANVTAKVASASPYDGNTAVLFRPTAANLSMNADTVSASMGSAPHPSARTHERSQTFHLARGDPCTASA